MMDKERKDFECFLETILAKNRYRDFYLQYAIQGVQRGKEYIKLFEYITRHSLSGKKVLVVGAGNGGEAVAYAKEGGQITTIDIDPLCIKLLHLRAKDEKVSFHIVQTDIEQPSLESESFDIVFMTDVIEHIQHPEKALSHIARVLKKDGFLFMNSVNPYSPHNIIGLDPHYKLRGVTLLPYIIAKWYVTKIRRVSPTYGVYTFPLLSWLKKTTSYYGLSLVNATFEFHLNEALEKINNPHTIKSALKRKIHTIFAQLHLKYFLSSLIRVYYILNAFFAQEQVLICKKK